MSELSAAAAAALGVPEPIVLRSAAARATETGMSVDDILSAWAGGGSVATPAPAEPAAEPAQAAEQTTEVEVETTTAPAETPPSEPAETPAARPGTVTRSPVPAEVTAAQAANLPEVITVPTAGIRERMNLSIPRWLAALMLIIPAFALFALGGSATGACGDATELTTDVITGEIVNCDGTEFTGSGAGGGGSDFVAQGGALYAAAPGNCQGCHAANGQGSGSIPGLTGVLTTFGACEDQIEWVTLGSQGFRDAGRSTYGDSDKPVNGGMPAFGGTLTPEQLASVVVFERVRFGGVEPAQALSDCGLGATEGDEPGEGGAPGEESPEGETPGGEPPAEGEEVTSTTVGG